jgi:hypothetical protein
MVGRLIRSVFLGRSDIMGYVSFLDGAVLPDGYWPSRHSDGMSRNTDGHEPAQASTLTLGARETMAVAVIMTWGNALNGLAGAPIARTWDIPISIEPS